MKVVTPGAPSRGMAPPLDRHIVADSNIPGSADLFGQLGHVRLVNGRELTPQELGDADVLLTRSVTRVDAGLLAGTGVKFVGSATSGVDHIDLDYLREHDIGFAHAPGSNANSVVEYVLAALASIGDTLERLLAGGVVGIVGYGIIGKRLAAALGSLGIEYRVYDPWLVQADIQKASTLERVLKADVVSLHCSLTDRRPWPSRHLLGADELAVIGRESLLINASRGPVIDNRALRNRLATHSGPGVVLDVWEREPCIDAALLQRVHYGTPHIAGYSLDGKLLATRMLYEAAALHFGVEAVAASHLAGVREPVAVAAGVHGADLLRALITRFYDIDTDDRNLRAATLSLDSRLAAGGFDRLRRHYPERRELRGARVLADELAPVDVRILRALGCSYLPGEEYVS